jgi:hypothetical protein
VAKTQKTELRLVDKGLSRFVSGLNQRGQSAVFRGMNRAAALAVESMTDLADQQIYSTPERSYRRTMRLRGSMRAWVDHDAKGFDLHMQAAVSPKDYAPYNELGTYDHRVTPEEIQRRADQAAATLVKLEFGRGQGRGLEARPFFYPSFVFVSKMLPGLIWQEFRNITP